MPRFRISAMLLIFSLIPIGIGFAWGSEMNMMLALTWLFPTERVGDQIVAWGWPANVTNLLEPYFDNLLYPVAIPHKAGLVIVIGTCALLGLLRLTIAKLTALMLIVMLPFALAFYNYRTVGKIYILSADWIITACVVLLCCLAWYAARHLAARYCYTKSEGTNNYHWAENVAFIAIALLIISNSISGWIWLQRIEDYFKETGGL